MEPRPVSMSTLKAAVLFLWKLATNAEIFEVHVSRGRFGFAVRAAPEARKRVCMFACIAGYCRSTALHMVRFLEVVLL